MSAWKKRARLRLAEIEAAAGDCIARAHKARDLKTDLHLERQKLTAHADELRQHLTLRGDDPTTTRRLESTEAEIEQVDAALRRLAIRQEGAEAESAAINGLLARCKKVAKEIGLVGADFVGAA